MCEPTWSAAGLFGNEDLLSCIEHRDFIVLVHRTVLECAGELVPEIRAM